MAKRQTMIYKTVQRKQNIEQQEQHEKSGVASCTPLLTPVVLLLSNIRWHVLNKERAGIVITQREHIRGHL